MVGPAAPAARPAVRVAPAVDPDAFLHWASSSPEYQQNAAAISQIVMRYGLKEDSRVDVIFGVLQHHVAFGTRYYPVGEASSLGTALREHTWNCESLSRLLVVTYCMLRNYDVTLPPHVRHREFHGRRLSQPYPLARASIDSFQPHVRVVRADGSAREIRYTFRNHTWVEIEDVEYDLLMGRSGAAAVAAAFPTPMEEGPPGVWSCNLPPEGGRYRMQEDPNPPVGTEPWVLRPG